MDRIEDDISRQIIQTVHKLAMKKGVDELCVRDVLKEMNITNRVFYNRFANLEEVLEILYTQMTEKVRESLSIPWEEGTDFFQQIEKIALQTLIISYEAKQSLSSFVFENDSINQDNFSWWDEEIKKLIQSAMNQGLVREDLNPDDASYTIWCFIRGFNADAMARGLSREEASRRFSYGFGILLEGIKRKPSE